MKRCKHADSFRVFHRDADGTTDLDVTVARRCRDCGVILPLGPATITDDVRAEMELAEAIASARDAGWSEWAIDALIEVVVEKRWPCDAYSDGKHCGHPTCCACGKDLTPADESQPGGRR